MRKPTFLIAIFGVGLLLIGVSLYQVSAHMGLIDGTSFKEVIGVIGLFFIGYCWLNGKGTTQVATQAGLALGTGLQRKERPAPRSRHKTPPPGPTEPENPKQPPLRKRAVFLYRKPRADCDIKQGGTSWLGGLPALGDVDWPRDKAGALMHHVMQIDLSDAGPFLKVQGLPTSGSLAVFVALGEEDTTFETKVRYIANPQGETSPPEPLAPVGDFTTGGLAVAGVDPSTLGTLPRWTVDLVRLEITGENALADELSALAPLGTGMNVNTQTFADHLPNGRDPSYWHSAQLFAQSLDRAVRSDAGDKLFTGMADKPAQTLAGYRKNGFPKRPDGPAPDEIEKTLQADIDKYRAFAARAQELKAQMQGIAAAIMGWAFAKDPWAVMSPDDLEVFRTHFAPFEYDTFGSDGYITYQCSEYSYSRLTGLAQASLQEMVRGPDEVFRLLPDVIQRAVDCDHQTPGMPHQMFGPPAWIQDAAAWHEEDHLLLQIVHDEVIGLRLGDAGHIQVWISPDDLAAGNWDAITSTFEAH